MSHSPFTAEMTVAFRHCDPAGIVFYPRYFEMINDFVEAFFDRGLGASFHALHVGRKIGTPLASVHCDFKAPSRWNDVLHQSMTVTSIGGAAIGLKVRFASPEGQTRLEAQLTIVTIDLETMRSIRLPEDVRQALTPFVEPGADALASVAAGGF